MIMSAKTSTKGPDYGQVDIKVFNWRGRRNGVSHFSAFLFFLTHYSPPLNRQIAFVLFPSHTEKDKTTRLYSIYASPKVRKSLVFCAWGLVHSLARVMRHSPQLSFTYRTVFRWGTPQIRHASDLFSLVHCHAVSSRLGWQTLTFFPPYLSASKHKDIVRGWTRIY